MKKSLSLLSTNHLDLENDIKSKINDFNIIHFDLTDGKFCPTLGLSILTLEQLAQHKEYKIDLHLLVENPLLIFKRIKNLHINSLIFHQETISSEEFINLDLKMSKKGIAVLPGTNISKLKNYIDHADSVLLLCITPSLFPQENGINILERIEDFNKIFPDFKGSLIIDGGVTKENFEELNDFNVSNVVLGKKFFD